MTLFHHEILGHDAFLSLDPIFVGLENSLSLKWIAVKSAFATFGIQLKSSEAGDFPPFLPFSPLRPFLEITVDVHGIFWQIRGS